MKDIYNRINENEFDNGFIYPIFNAFVGLINKINIVEILKKITYVLFSLRYKNKKEPDRARILRKVNNYTVDSFIILKFMFIFSLWRCNINSKFALSIVVYLLIMNLHTYFYHHIWTSSAALDEHLSVNRVKRRFMNLFIAYLYMIISYGYMYDILLNQYYKADITVSKLNYIIYSISNSFASSYDKIEPLGNIGDIIKLSQVIMSFIFITLILTCSIPKANKK